MERSQKVIEAVKKVLSAEEALASARNELDGLLGPGELPDGVRGSEKQGRPSTARRAVRKAKLVKPSGTERERVLHVLTAHPKKVFKTSELIEAAGSSGNNIYTVLGRLCADKQAVRVKQGHYRLKA